MRFSRRKFFGMASAAAAAVGTGPLAEAAAPTALAGEDYYAKMGVAPIINAAGTFTFLTSACMPPEVIAAVTRAAQHPVHLHELQVKSGEYVAKKLKCEGALVTSGASGSITLAAAACILKANPALTPLDLPQKLDNNAPYKKMVVTQKAHRYGYDHAIALAGARMVEVVTVEDYRAALAKGDVVMTNFFNAAEEEEGEQGTAKIGREEWLRIAHEHGVPCHNDAAADMPPIENLWKYTQMGFDLVSFSGGKGIRGPQNAGLLLGRKDLTDLALTSANPINGVGRGMKVAKEQIVGMVAAVDWLLSQTNESMQAEFNKRCDRIIAEVKGVPSVKTEVVVPLIANHVPHLLIRFDPATTGVTAQQVIDSLRTQNPPIELNIHSGKKPGQGVPSDANTLVLTTWMLQPGEDVIVGRRIREAITKKA